MAYQIWLRPTSLQSLFLLHTLAMLASFCPPYRTNSPLSWTLCAFASFYWKSTSPDFCRVASFSSFCSNSNAMLRKAFPPPGSLHSTLISPLLIYFVFLSITWLPFLEYNFSEQDSRTWALPFLVPGLWWCSMNTLRSPRYSGSLLFSLVAESGTGVMLGFGLLTGTRCPYWIQDEL